ncbi:MAG: helix-turn-helix domain-containing protein [Candidatus Pacearchaeota archaeon]
MEKSKQLIPNRLRKKRREFGYSLRQVAYLMAIQNPADIAQWEQGTKLPNATNLCKLCALYRTSLHELYYEYQNTLKQDIALKEYHLFDSNAIQ